MSNLEEIEKVLSQVQPVHRHSYFQLKYFLIGKEPTIQAKLWRCITELTTRKENVQNIKLEIEDITDEIELLNIKIEKNTFKNDPESKIINRKLERKKNNFYTKIVQLNRKQEELLEECDFFIETFSFFSKIEKLKPFDDLESQKQYWESKLVQDLNLRLTLNKPLDIEIIKTILCLEDDSSLKQNTITMLEKSRQLAITSQGKLIEESNE